MTDIKIKSEMGKNYIIVSANEEWQETIAAKMLQNNQIDRILPIECRHIDNKFYYYYPLPFLKSIDAYFISKIVNFDKLFTVFESIIDNLKKGEIYFLPEHGFIVEKEWMFWDDVRKEVIMCYVPGLQNDIREDIIKFTEYLMHTIDSKDRKAAKFLYKIYDELSDYGHIYEDNVANNEGQVSTDSYRITINVLEKLDAIISSFQGIENLVKDSESKAYKSSKPVNRIVGRKSGNKIFALRPCGQELRGDFRNQWGTDYFIIEIGEGFDTEITIGRGCECNMTLPFSHISRIHATLCYSGGEFYVYDKVSTNGTYVNGKRITANKKTPLRLQDQITFADISFSLMVVSATEK